MDIVGAFHVSGSVGFGLRLHGEATVAGVPISLAAGAKIDPIAADLGNGQLQIGGAVANSVDVGIGPFLQRVLDNPHFTHTSIRKTALVILMLKT